MDILSLFVFMILITIIIYTNKMNKNFYITTTLPYVNSDPHIGFAAEILRADCLARHKREQGFNVFFNTGTDEHGLKIHRKAEEAGVDTQEYCDGYAKKFNDLKESLNLSYNNFIRTTDAHHIKAAQAFWEKCNENGDIYKKNYSVKYCVGCELELTESDLVDGKCPHHPGQDLEIIEEENYFFRWSNYQEKLLKFYENNPAFVVPSHRQNEIKTFVERGINDFSISRLKSKMPWGVEVPGDKDHVMYVWFDALVNYISCLGFPKEDGKMKEFWPGMQVAGKDNLRQQTAMWQAMLMSAGIANSTQVLIFGFITSGGQKMSKSIGNVINPYDVIEKYGQDATRYFLLSQRPFEDTDLGDDRFKEIYNADLANGLGNLVARTSNMLEKNKIELEISFDKCDDNLKKSFEEKMSKLKLDDALEILWTRLREQDEFLSTKAPWKLKEKDEIKAVLEPVAQNILCVAGLLKSFMPNVAEKIEKQFSEKQIKKGESLFPRV